MLKRESGFYHIELSVLLGRMAIFSWRMEKEKEWHLESLERLSPPGLPQKDRDFHGNGSEADNANH
jgi:hypothetical protein